MYNSNIKAMYRRMSEMRGQKIDEEAINLTVGSKRKPTAEVKASPTIAIPNPQIFRV